MYSEVITVYPGLSVSDNFGPDCIRTHTGNVSFSIRLGHPISGILPATQLLRNTKPLHLFATTLPSPGAIAHSRHLCIEQRRLRVLSEYPLLPLVSLDDQFERLAIGQPGQVASELHGIPPPVR